MKNKTKNLMIDLFISAALIAATGLVFHLILTW